MAARGTTPTFRLTLKDSSIDLGLASNVYVTFRQARKILTKTGDDLEIDRNIVRVYLTQMETLGFSESIQTEVQINWVYADGSRGATTVARVTFGEQLIPEVLS